MKFKSLTIVILSALVLSLPIMASANLQMSDLVQGAQAEVSSHSYIVIDQITGQIMMQKAAQDPWVPASLTKVLTALTVLDQNPDMNKVCPVTKDAEVGGARLAAYTNATYRLKDLLNASLVASANNATVALADCVLPREQFMPLMNQKAQALGATHSTFYEPSGMDPRNTITAEDYAAIARAGFSTPLIQQITQKKTVSFSSVSKPRKSHYLTTTDKLLGEKGVTVIAGKTGYLDESLYNFALSSKVGEHYYITVVLGSPTKNGSFDDAKQVTHLASVILPPVLSSIPGVVVVN